MNRQELLAAGFREYPPFTKYAECSYQLKLTDERGTKYFINVNQYISDRTDWEMDITYNDGCEFFPAPAALSLKVYANIESWTVPQLLEVAEQFWVRLNPRYYE